MKTEPKSKPKTTRELNANARKFIAPAQIEKVEALAKLNRFSVAGIAQLALAFGLDLIAREGIPVACIRPLPDAGPSPKEAEVCRRLMISVCELHAIVIRAGVDSLAAQLETGGVMFPVAFTPAESPEGDLPVYLPAAVVEQLNRAAAAHGLDDGANSIASAILGDACSDPENLAEIIADGWGNRGGEGGAA